MDSERPYLHSHSPRWWCCGNTTEASGRHLRGSMSWSWPFVARGSGPGLSGGAVVEPGAPAGGEPSRMRSVLASSILENQRGSPWQPGWSTSWRDPGGERAKAFITPPIPPSQVVCRHRRNVAENAGRVALPQIRASPATTCSREGFARWQDHPLGGRLAEMRGWSCVRVFIGSGSTLGIATAITRAAAQSRRPLKCCLAISVAMEAAGEAVGRSVTRRQVLPVGNWRSWITSPFNRSTTSFGPRTNTAKSAAVLLIELDGPAARKLSRAQSTRSTSPLPVPRSIRRAREASGSGPALERSQVCFLQAVAGFHPHLFTFGWGVSRSALRPLLAAI